MKKYYTKRKHILGMALSLCSLLTMSAQDLHHTAGDLWVVGNEVLYVGGNVSTSGTPGVQITLSGDTATDNPDLIVAGSNNGNVGFYRSTPGDPTWSIFSFPVNESIQDFTELAGNSLRTNAGRYALAPYVNTNSASARWDYYPIADVATAGNFNYGQGYTLSRTAAGQVFAEGAPTNANAVLSLTTASGAHFWHAVGNPFTAHLPGNSGANANNIITTNAAAFDPAFTALYVWNGSSYDIINQLSSAYYVPPGQGFMVNMKDADESFTLTKAHVMHPSGTTTFYRSSNVIETLTVTLESNGSSVQTELKYLAGVTTGLDPGYDAGAYQNGTPSFALNTHLVTDSEGIDFALQCLPNEQYETMVVPLSVYADSGEALSFSVTRDAFPEAVNVFVEDRALNTYMMLEDGDSYSVTLNAAQAGTGRFYLHTTESTSLSTDDLSTSGVSMFKSDLRTVKVNGLQVGQDTSFELYSITGQLVYRSTFRSETSNTVTLPRSLSAGIYVARVHVAASGELTKKIIIE